MTYRRTNATRSAACDAEVDLLDGGTIEIRTGTQPTNVGDADQGTLLATLTFGTPAFGNASNGVATANAITSATAVDSGTAGHAVLKTSGSTKHSDCSCGQGSGDINFDNNVIVSGGEVDITSMTITHPV